LALWVLAFTFAYAGVASATPIWMNGDEITYGQGKWGGQFSNPGAVLLLNDYATVYAATSGLVTIGLPTTGFSMIFSGPLQVIGYLPAAGNPAPLDQNYVNPFTTVSGTFGGDVLALELNVDFSDAGFLLGASGVPFGNLVLENFGPLSLLNGRTVRQILAAANTDLGGGVSIFSIADLDPLVGELTLSFSGGFPPLGPPPGTPSTFAQDHLVAPTSAPAQVPEPGSLLLFGTGVLLVARHHRGRRSRSVS
jgi:hypothetical protein